MFFFKSINTVPLRSIEIAGIPAIFRQFFPGIYGRIPEIGVIEIYIFQKFLPFPAKLFQISMSDIRLTRKVEKKLINYILKILENARISEKYKSL
jgi:hypothetical protein